MNDVVLVLGKTSLTLGQVVLGLAGLSVVLLVIVTVLLLRTRRERALEAAMAAERAREMDDKVAELTRIQSEMTGRMRTMAEVFGSRQSDFVRMISERIDGLQHRVGQGLEASTRHQSENLSKLNERLAVIDAAQQNLTNLTGEIVGLKDILSNKQSRGAYGQGRMEAIIRDGLPPSAFEFQATLSNRTRPDCLVRLPGDGRGLVIDAKFPLEGFTLFREAKGDEARNRAAAKVRNDMLVHVKDIAEKYLIPGETQDIALLFVPAESIYADLAEHFDDVVQKAHRARIVIVSPSLLTLAIQVMQALVRDARIREEARVIQIEVQKLLEDVERLDSRVAKLDAHFRQAQEDVSQIRVSADKIVKRGERIETLDFEEGEAEARAELLRLQGRNLRAVD
ncbi:DNA recombination protein RmuC [Microvirga arsenatis]|uniref:DNA recombination protein RmuC homolog n=1 Tax=Microvirga arsenatis TaxID=2692265 RepID=A0ABW9YXH0_9HYPH|nr:DNA recombination protein RmuC [Microvirga arsenatis]NBJ11792.1 DNA recombination protein RmuC [Microvirga arsenatis]NBJ25073.1 DNA recombination protein RmuC [Microvirga arsenatis]